ncbi:MAG: DNA topoisomerase VI subunit B [Candidatus Micrarchaeaceae archaeon]
MERVSAEELFKEFKDHSVAEFFKKNRQMLGYSGMVRSLTTIVHEYVTNSLDACEEANIMPSIKVSVRETGENKYIVEVDDNGPGIPKNFIGRALGVVLAGTKFHRYMQQRGQQGIGAAGCTLFAQVTTGKPVHTKSETENSAYECDVSIDVKSNKPIIANLKDVEKTGTTGLSVVAEVADVKYEKSDHGVYEYIKRTALANPHAEIKLVEPDGKEQVFPRSVNELPKRPFAIRPHPLGLEVNDLLEFAHASENRTISSFLISTFSRVTAKKVNELKESAKSVDFGKDPHQMTWADAEEIIKAIKATKWIAPDTNSLSTIGERQIGAAIKSILNPSFFYVTERKPKVFRGGIPFVVEAGVAYGGNSGKVQQNGATGGVILRFANRVPLLFDSANCAITEAVREIQWRRYGISNFDEEPVSVFVNVSSVYVPYAGVGKQAIAGEEEIVEEIKLAVMDSARKMQRYISNRREMGLEKSRYETILRYAGQLAKDISELTGSSYDEVNRSIRLLISSKYKRALKEGEEEGQQKPGSEAR